MTELEALQRQMIELEMFTEREMNRLKARAYELMHSNQPTTPQQAEPVEEPQCTT